MGHARPQYLLLVYPSVGTKWEPLLDRVIGHTILKDTGYHTFLA
jgi:hypothetical protein